MCSQHVVAHRNAHIQPTDDCSRPLFRDALRGPAHRTMQLIVKAGKCFAVDTSPSATVLELKARVSERAGRRSIRAYTACTSSPSYILVSVRSEERVVVIIV